MTNGFKPVSVREDVYAVVSKLADEDETSIADVITKAVENYKDYRKKLLQEFVRIRQLLEQEHAKALK